MADITLTDDFADFSSNLHLSDLPDSWSNPLKQHYVQQGDFSSQVSKQIGALGAAVYALQQSIDTHGQSVQQSAENADQVSRSFAQLTHTLTQQMQAHTETLHAMQQQVKAIQRAQTSQQNPKSDKE